MNRSILVLTAFLLTTCAFPVTAEAARTEYRKYVGGAGVGVPPGLDTSPVPPAALCLDLAAPSEVCFRVLAGDSTVELWAKHDYLEPFPIAAAVYFEDAAGMPVAPRTPFCGHLAATAIPAGAAYVRVLVGPLANDSATLPSCATGAGVVGSVKAYFA